MIQCRLDNNPGFISGSKPDDDDWGQQGIEKVLLLQQLVFSSTMTLLGQPWMEATEKMCRHPRCLIQECTVPHTICNTGWPNAVDEMSWSVL